MKSTFHGLISWHDIDAERISGWQYMLIETSNTKKQIEKRLEGERGKEQNILKLWDYKDVTYI